MNSYNQLVSKEDESSDDKSSSGKSFGLQNSPDGHNCYYCDKRKPLNDLSQTGTGYDLKNICSSCKAKGEHK